MHLADPDWSCLDLGHGLLIIYPKPYSIYLKGTIVSRGPLGLHVRGCIPRRAPRVSTNCGLKFSQRNLLCKRNPKNCNVVASPSIRFSGDASEVEGALINKANAQICSKPCARRAVEFRTSCVGVYGTAAKALIGKTNTRAFETLSKSAERL